MPTMPKSKITQKDSKGTRSITSYFQRAPPKKGNSLITGYFQHQQQLSSAPQSESGAPSTANSSSPVNDDSSFLDSENNFPNLSLPDSATPLSNRNRSVTPSSIAPSPATTTKQETPASSLNRPISTPRELLEGIEEENEQEDQDTEKVTSTEEEMKIVQLKDGKEWNVVDLDDEEDVGEYLATNTTPSGRRQKGSASSPPSALHPFVRDDDDQLEILSVTRKSVAPQPMVIDLDPVPVFRSRQPPPRKSAGFHTPTRDMNEIDPFLSEPILISSGLSSPKKLVIPETNPTPAKTTTTIAGSASKTSTPSKSRISSSFTNTPATAIATPKAKKPSPNKPILKLSSPFSSPVKPKTPAKDRVKSASPMSTTSSPRRIDEYFKPTSPSPVKGQGMVIKSEVIYEEEDNKDNVKMDWEYDPDDRGEFDNVGDDNDDIKVREGIQSETVSPQSDGTMSIGQSDTVSPVIPNPNAALSKASPAKQADVEDKSQDEEKEKKQSRIKRKYDTDSDFTDSDDSFSSRSAIDLDDDDDEFDLDKVLGGNSGSKNVDEAVLDPMDEDEDDEKSDATIDSTVAFFAKRNAEQPPSTETSGTTNTESSGSSDALRRSVRARSQVSYTNPTAMEGISPNNSTNAITESPAIHIAPIVKSKFSLDRLLDDKKVTEERQQQYEELNAQLKRKREALDEGNSDSDLEDELLGVRNEYAQRLEELLQDQKVRIRKVVSLFKPVEGLTTVPIPSALFNIDKYWQRRKSFFTANDLIEVEMGIRELKRLPNITWTWDAINWLFDTVCHGADSLVSDAAFGTMVSLLEHPKWQSLSLEAINFDRVVMFLEDFGCRISIFEPEAVVSEFVVEETLPPERNLDEEGELECKRFAVKLPYHSTRYVFELFALALSKTTPSSMSDDIATVGDLLRLLLDKQMKTFSVQIKSCVDLLLQRWKSQIDLMLEQVVSNMAKFLQGTRLFQNRLLEILVPNSPEMFLLRRRLASQFCLEGWTPPPPPSPPTDPSAKPLRHTIPSAFSIQTPPYTVLLSYLNNAPVFKINADTNYLEMYFAIKSFLYALGTIDHSRQDKSVSKVLVAKLRELHNRIPDMRGTDLEKTRTKNQVLFVEICVRAAVGHTMGERQTTLHEGFGNAAKKNANSV